MKEPEIVVLSGENRLDQYGNFFFKDKAGNEHKIGVKRKEKTELMALVVANLGKAVKLLWEDYTRDGITYPFIKGIELVEGALLEPVKTETQPIPQIDTPPSKSREDAIREGMWFKHRAFALSYSKDLVCAGSIEVKELYDYAERMLGWLNKDMV